MEADIITFNITNLQLIISHYKSYAINYISCKILGPTLCDNYSVSGKDPNVELRVNYLLLLKCWWVSRLLISYENMKAVLMSLCNCVKGRQAGRHVVRNTI